MDKLKQLAADLKAADEQIDRLLANASLTADQQAEHDALVAKRAGLVAAFKTEKGRLAREAERADLDAEAADAEARHAAAEQRRQRAANGQPPNTITTRDQPPAGPGTVAAPGPRQADDRVPATVKRFGTLKHFRGARGGRDADLRAYRFGMWGLAQLSLQMPNRFGFDGAVEFVHRQMGSVVTSKDASGYGYLIPEEFGTDLIDLRERYGVARRLFKSVPMTSDTRTDPRRQGGLTGYFVGEGAAGTESNKVWDRVRLTAKDIMVLSRVSAQVNADAVINWGDDLAGEIAYAFSKLEDDCGFNGDGSSTYGGIVGVRTKLTNFDGAGTASAGIQTGAGNSWSALTLANFQNCVGKLPQYADTPGVAWVCHRAFYYGVMQVLELAAGGVTANEVQQGDRRPRPLFLGYPVEFTQIMPASTGSAQIPVLLGDYGLAASFGDRQQDAIMFSEHATVGGESVFERNEVAIRGTERIDINVHDVGDASNAGPIVAIKTT